MLISWQPGESIANGRFTIQEVLSTGVFGITYKVRDTRGQLYAIFTLNLTIQNRTDFKEQQVKLINEAFTLKGFRHPHIVEVYEIIQEGELLGILMEYIDGTSVSRYIERNGKLTEAEALKYIDQLAQSLQYIHERNYLHMDVKPDSILLRNDIQQVVLIDFGVARIISSQNITNLNTHDYAPIEQHQKQGNFGPQTDVYALAATLYYLLTATVPVSAWNRKINEQELPEPRIYSPSISDRVNNAITAAMTIEPELRTKNIEEFRENLGLIITELPRTEIPTEISLEREKYSPKEILPRFRSIERFLGIAGFGVGLIILTIIGQRLKEEQQTENTKPVVTETSEPTAIPTRYIKLETLLKAQKFQEADNETNKIMIEVANKQNEDWLTTEDAEKFPCQELVTIDKLWLKYSGGKFGISVQQEIYQNLGGTGQLDTDVWRSFGERVGWRVNKQFLNHSKLNFSLSAPNGHLPVIGELTMGRWFGNVFPPVDKCRGLDL